jgi:hypothetical protein
MRQHNLRVTGSLTLNGENVVSASQLSALTQTLTGQYATTSSNSYNGNQTITGSVIVTGTITANEFHTTFVTSSVLYTSGSSKFGDTNDDIMEVTGSLKVNGNITANNLNGIVSGSSQLTSSYDTRYVVSGSITQTTWDNIASKPSGIVSSSAQVLGGTGIHSGSYTGGNNIVSGSSQITLQSTTGQLSASRVDGLNLTQISSGSYTASIGQTFNVNTNTIITGSLSVTSLSGSGINYLAYSGGIVTAISGTAAIKYNQEFTATLGQTIFTPSVGYISGLIDVYYNGTKLSATDYTATNGYNISLVQGADLAGDIIEIAIYNPVSGVSNNVLRQQTTFTASVAQTTFTINYTPGLIDVFFNGSRLANEEYTANNGTSIILSEATTGGEILDVFVYSYQVGAFSGVGGSGVLNQLAYWSSQSGLTGSNSLTFDGTTLTISGSLVPAVSGAYDLGSTSKPFRHIYVGSGSIYLVNNQGQVTNTISAQSIVTTDTLNSGSISLVNSLPTGTVSGSSQIVGILTSLNTATASFTPRITNLESKSASVDISITNINSFTASNANTSLNLLTGSLATTGSNTFRGTTIMSGSTYVTGDFVVFGSSSIQYISASSVSIGTNIVQLNTANPAVRYAGLSVQDSGSSAGVTGSMLWDSVCNRWIYSNPSGVGYSGGVIMSGPRAATFGTETTLTCNYIAKSGGGDHLYDSCIQDVNGVVTIGGTLCTSGIICSANLEIKQSSNNRLVIDCVNTANEPRISSLDASNNPQYLTINSYDLKIKTNCGEALRITDTKQFIVGATSMAYANSIGYVAGFMSDFTGQSVVSIARKGQTLASQGMFIGIDSTSSYFWNRDNVAIQLGTNDTTKMTIACTGQVTFACTVCAPYYVSSNASNISYQDGQYIVGNSESEVCVLGPATSAYVPMKYWIADRTGTIRVKFSAFIVSGPNYWAYQFRKNASSVLANGHYNNTLESGYTSNVHTYTTFTNTLSGLNPGDCITYEMASANSGGTPTTGSGTQCLYVKELRFLSNSPSISNNITNNVFGEWVGIGTSCPLSNLEIRNNNEAAYDASVDNGQDGCGVTLTVRNGSTVTNSFAQLNLQVSGDSGRAVGRIVLIRKDSASSHMAFVTETANSKIEIMRMGCYGASSHNFIMVGRTNAGISAGTGITLNATTGQMESSVNGDDILNLNRNVSDGKIIRLFKNCTEVGSISTNTYSLPSDINFKTNINNLELGLNLVNKLRPVSYNHKIDDSSSALSTGFIAQEMQCVLNELGVQKNKYFILQHKPIEDVNESQYWLDYTKMVPVLTKAIQEQQCIIQCLTNRIEQLENN